jgi:hypothetical protein
MALPAPDWISFEAEKTEGLDLLGLRAPVQRIGNQLFNGVTTVTPKVRYLSVLAWIVWRYSEARLPNSWKSFISFAEAQEAMIVMANRLKSRSILNLVGVTKGDNLLDSGDDTLPLVRLAQQVAYNIYVTSSRQLNLTHDENSAFAGLTKERGMELAKTFDQLIGVTTYGKQLARDARKNRVARKQLEELADAVFLDRIPREERNILISAIIPQNPESGERDRVANYALLLWLTRAKREAIDEQDVFAAAAALPRNLPACLVAVLNGWLEYMIRDQLAVTHEAVFEAVMRQIDIASAERGGPALAADVVAILLNDTDEHNGMLRQLGLLTASDSIDKIHFASLQERVQRACADGVSVSGGLRRWRGGLVETTIYEMALKAGPASAVLLPVAWCLAAERMAPEVFKAVGEDRRILTLGSLFQIGIEDVVLPKLDEFSRKDRTVREVMAELITRTVQQHLRVAWTRFSPPLGKDVSVLVADRDTWARNNGFRAGRTDSRLWVAISWLRQLGLIDDDGLTIGGERILDRALTTLNRGLS